MFDFKQVELKIPPKPVESDAAIWQLEYRALTTLRQLGGASCSSTIQSCMRAFADELGALHYAFIALDRSATEDPLRPVAESVEGWSRELTPQVITLLSASREASASAYVRHTWFQVKEPHRAGGKYAGLQARGIRHGVLVPAETVQPGSVAGCMVLAFANTPLSAALRQDIHFPAYIVHASSLVLDAYQRLPAKPARSKVKLSSRESECVRWAAIGKTSWETACILSVSERTVNFHLSNAFAKLNVNNKQAAVAQAILQDLI